MQTPRSKSDQTNSTRSSPGRVTQCPQLTTTPALFIRGAMDHLSCQEDEEPLNYCLQSVKSCHILLPVAYDYIPAQYGIYHRSAVSTIAIVKERY